MDENFNIFNRFTSTSINHCNAVNFQVLQYLPVFFGLKSPDHEFTWLGKSKKDIIISTC